MAISPGALVTCRQVEGIWVVKAQADDGRWRLVRRDDHGRLTGRLAGAGDMTEVEPAPEFEPGISILVGGELHTVVQDHGAEIEARTPERRHRTRGRCSADLLNSRGRSYAPAMDPLRATIEEFAAEGYTHIECYCPRCRMTRLRPISWLPRISLGLAIAQLSARLRCAKCGGQLRSVKPWRMEDVLGADQHLSGRSNPVPGGGSKLARL